MPTATATLERPDRTQAIARPRRVVRISTAASNSPTAVTGAVVVPIRPDVVVGRPAAEPRRRAESRRRAVPDPSTATRMLAGATLALVAAIAIAVLPGGTDVGPSRIDLPTGPVAAGSTVVVRGSCGHQTSGTASSLAFASASGPRQADQVGPAGPGVAAFATDADGGFTARAVVARQATPGTYVVSVRCGGAPAAATADLEVAAPAAV